MERITGSISAMEAELAALDISIARAEISGLASRLATQENIELRAKISEEVQSLRFKLTNGNPSLSKLVALFQSATLEVELAERRLDAAIP